MGKMGEQKGTWTNRRAPRGGLAGLGYVMQKANRRAPRGGVKKSYEGVGNYRVEPNGCRAVCN